MAKRSNGQSKKRKDTMPSSDHELNLWKKVDVGLPESGLVPGNHYDNDYDDGSGVSAVPDVVRRSAEQDLEATGGEEMGFFFGLEVISGENYKVETDESSGVKHVHLLTKKPLFPATTAPAPAADNHATTADQKKQAKGAIDMKGFSKSERSKTAETDHTDTNATTVIDDEQLVVEMQLSWLTATGGVELHPMLCQALLKQGFWTPTPIQAATLPASILGQRNVVGAAPTGSGKTLAFLLPICQALLQEKERLRHTLRALILSPTRELALQTYKACESLLTGSSAAVVGGLAVSKQNRLLERQPPIVIGTPGRLWDLISTRAHPYLKDLSKIQHLVVDEADRMIKQGSFPELTRILDAVYLANPMEEQEKDLDDNEGEDLERDDESDRFLGLPGIPGEARVEMLSDDILQRIEQQRQDGTLMEPVTDGDSSDNVFGGEAEEEEIKTEERRSLLPIFRRTYVYSATLTLPASSSSFKKRRHVDVDGAIAEILEKARAKGKTKLVDLTTVSNKESAAQSVVYARAKGKSEVQDIVRLPPGLTLHHIKCTQKHKDSHLYAYLMTTEQGSNGPCLVFCNSIAAVRRVGATLMALGLDIRILHAQMQQRARLKAVESLKESGRRSVVVASDVAARGLDIPSVASVVHYDVPRTVDIFIHRSGRTARGMGVGATGSSVSLVAPGDERNYSRIAQTLKAPFKPFLLEGRLLRAAQERVNLACKVVSAEDRERKCRRDNKWFRDQAAEAGLEVDETLLDNNVEENGIHRREDLRAKEQLSKLLAEPIQIQRYGKFLSTHSALTLMKPAVPTTVREPSRKRRKRS